jgi:hypothetical protein
VDITDIQISHPVHMFYDVPFFLGGGGKAEGCRFQHRVDYVPSWPNLDYS